jgi:hypothetical protein
MTEAQPARTRSPLRLSVPVRARKLARPLTQGERAAFVAIADVLVPKVGENPAPSEEPGYDEALARSLVARSDAFEEMAAVARRLAGADPATIEGELRRLHAYEPNVFQPLSSTLVGAYFQLPTVLERIGYPGQRSDPPGLEEAVDQLEGGILDSVRARGSIFVPTGDESST